MSWLKASWAELIGLFVDDGSFAVAIVVWLALCGLLFPLLDLAAAIRPAILFAGLVAILVESATRQARHTPGRRPPAA